ncbi:uncharacterized protein ColSpa_04598 [Colletotrichum spaethianum]|uniref:Uncharacterized protein n=1 Tax=Colletotrichum spaethianum TaxID=700344 RepID=A0AA37L9N2_9PEZI|nr:uncharacterized protein ColSpa_04598 [Colletotrichum spaethianum]GKT44417.1 hypothetical protein ColSpa_04598 [Colletotrichum spaethianum]
MIWTARAAHLSNDEKDMIRLIEEHGYDSFSNTLRVVENLRGYSVKICRSMVVMPAVVKAIVNSKSEISWESKFQVSSSSAILRRAGRFTIYRREGERGPVSLKHVLPSIRSSSVALSLNPISSAAFKRNFYGTRLTKDWQREGKAKSDHPPPVLKYYRYMLMLASSFPVYQMTVLLERVGSGTTFDYVAKMRKASMDLTHISPLYRDFDDPDPVTMFQHLRLVLKGGPQIQELLSTLLESVLPYEDHLIPTIMITLASPILAFVTEQVLRALRIPTAIQAWK